MDYYTGEIRMFAGNYAPEGWVFCDGRLVSVSTYPALFSLFGTTWGGDGVTTFGIPDFRGRLPIGQGQGTTGSAPLTARIIGQKDGTETVTLTTAQMPAHNHTFNVALIAATTGTPAANLILAEPTNGDEMYLPNSSAGQAADVEYGAQSISTEGANVAHSNLMPSLAINFIIALDGGLYPSRSN